MVLKNFITRIVYLKANDILIKLAVKRVLRTELQFGEKATDD